MASQNLYPAIIDGSMPAFPVLPNADNFCRIYFSLSKFNVTNDFAGVHLSIKKQSTGVSVVKTDETDIRTGAYRATGLLLLNSTLIHQVDNQNLYYVDVLDDDLKWSDGDYSGWLPGVIYQVQIRLSEENYDGSIGQANWLSENANKFSEWSTLCAIKPISQPYLTSSYIGYPADPEPPYYTTKSADLYFNYNRPVEDKESLYSYQFLLLEELSLNEYEVVEQSELMYTTRSQNPDVLQYTLSNANLSDSKDYLLQIAYTTLNNYNGLIEIPLRTDFNNGSTCDLTIYTIENVGSIFGGHDHHEIPTSVLNEEDNEGEDVEENDETDSPAPVVEVSDPTPEPFSTLGQESEEGYVALKLIGQIGTATRSEYMLRRASSKDNFNHWEDIKHITINNPVLNANVNILIEDMTIESGIFYKYGVQNLDQVDNHYYRGQLKVENDGQESTSEEDHDIYVIREFDHSYLLGENNRQLKLEFDNTMNNLSFNIDESTQKTYGVFPVIVRPGAARYRTFPVNGLISFYMDENGMFTTRDEVYGSEKVTKLYEGRDTTKASQQYNYVYEREFRNKVMQFLQDGRPKLFKSPTEGNILIRITGVSFSPNQTLSRLVYSFSATGTEIGEVNNKNLTKYKIFNLEKSADCTPSS